jgi:hypothetical protein
MKSGKSSNSLVNKLLYLAVPLVMLVEGCSPKYHVITGRFRMYSPEKEQLMNPSRKNPNTLSAEDMIKKYQDSVQARYQDSLLTLYYYEMQKKKAIIDKYRYDTLRATFPIRR